MKKRFVHGLKSKLLAILIEIPQEKTGCIFEMKYAEEGYFDAACAEAMKQIDTNDYAEFLRKNGIQTIHKYGIACYKKNCRIIYQKEFQK